MPDSVLLSSVQDMHEVSCSLLRTADLVPAHWADASGQFYYVWVMRDIEGHMIDVDPPYLKHAYSRFCLKQGLPIPVACCWNGMISCSMISASLQVCHQARAKSWHSNSFALSHRVIRHRMPYT